MPGREAQEGPEDPLPVAPPREVIGEERLDRCGFEVPEPCEALGGQLIREHVAQLVSQPRRGGSHEAAFRRLQVGCGQTGAQGALQQMLALPPPDLRTVREAVDLLDQDVVYQW